MISFKDMMKYSPPDISVFQKFGSGGYLSRAKFAVEIAEHDLVHARGRLLRDPNWGSEPKLVPDSDLVSMYAYWTIADDMLKRLDRMDPKEREKQLALDAKYGTFEDIAAKHADLDGRITEWERVDGKKVLYPALDRQLKRRLDTWEQGLNDIERHGFLEGDDPFESLADFCRERTIIEYAAMGIEILHMRYHEEGRMEPLPYLHTFLLRRLELDKKFRKVLNGQYWFLPWYEKTFWWHHPPEGKKRTRRKRRDA